MSERVVPETQKVVDPLFQIPEGLTGHNPSQTRPILYDQYGNPIGDVNLDAAVPEGTAVQSDAFFGVGPNAGDDFSGGIDVPASLSIEEQIFHFISTGQQVVDLVVDVPEQRGVIRFEFRVTKT